jgi:RND family efflux transporter MFP subunit
MNEKAAPHAPAPAGPQRPGRDPAGARGSRGGRIVVRFIAAALVLAAVAAGYYYFNLKLPQTAPTVAPTAAAPMALPVTVAHPLVEKIVEWDEYSGQFSAIEHVELRSRVSGYLESIHFQDGQMVKKGDLLFVVDPRPFQADVRLAEANLERDKAQLQRADLDLTRYSVLAKKDFASQQQFENARATAQAAAATVKADDAALAQAKLNLAFTQITAPVGGRIGRRQVSVGDLVIGGAVPSTTLLTTIVSLDPIYFDFYMSEADFLAYQAAVRQGIIASAQANSLDVFARLENETGWPHAGQLNFIDNQVDPGSGTILARAVFPNADLLITPGQFGRVRVPASGLHDAILIPDSAIVSDQSRKVVMTVKPDGTVEPKLIQPGSFYKGLRVVRAGLTPNDTIIIDGVMRARPGAKVAPQPGRIQPESQS